MQARCVAGVLSGVNRLVAEVAGGGEEHGDVVFVAGGDGVGVVFGSAGLNDGGDTGSGRLIDAVAEGEEGIGGEDGPPAPLAGLVGGDVHGIDAAHLPRSDADEGVVASEDDGVGFDVLHAAPGEFEALEFFGGGLAFGDDFPVGGGLADAVEVLHEEAAGDFTIVEAPNARRGEAWAFEEADVGLPLGLGGEDFEGIVVVVGGDDGFDEAIGEAEFFGSRGIDRTIEGEDRAEGADGVAGVGVAEGGGEFLGDGGTAGVVVLDDDGAGEVELADEIHGGVEIEEVVVGEFLAVELLCGSEGTGFGVAFDIEGGSLVGIFAVAEGTLLVEGKVELRRVVTCRFLGGDAVEVLGDGGVIAGGHLEGGEGEFTAEGCCPGSRAESGEDFFKLGVVCDDSDVGVVLGGGADHTGSADIDIFDGVFESDIGFRDGGFEGVEIHNDEFEGDNAVGLDGFGVAGEVGATEDGAVDLGMKGFDAAVHDFGEAGVGGDIDDGDAVLDEEFAGAAGGEDFEPEFDEGLGELVEVGLVTDADEGTTGSHRDPRFLWKNRGERGNETRWYRGGC